MKNWKTTLLGLLGGTTATTAITALASPEVNQVLQTLHVSPTILIIFSGVVKILRDICAKDAEKVLPETGQAGHSRMNLILAMAFAALLALTVFLAAGCTTLNVSMNTTAGDNNKPAVKTDAQADQNISPATTATIPLR